ncbi:MAG: D-tyrosyl-tRNA(Tyr) deacylase, partial [Nitrosopumilus sp.]|nr:D-tyrosyl-tRNA(Tyr) deacylase [Nitrosopumilus sp.]
MLCIFILIWLFSHLHSIRHIFQSLFRVHWWKLIRCPYIPYLMELLVAYRDDPAGYNMAKFLSQEMTLDGDIFHGKYYDLIIISTPSISADWLEEKYDYDGFVFLSN